MAKRKRRKTTSKTTKTTRSRKPKKSQEWEKLYKELEDTMSNFPSKKKYEEYIDSLVDIGEVEQKDILKSFTKFKALKG